MRLLQILKIVKYMLLVWIVVHSIRMVIVLSLFMAGNPGFDIIGGSMIALITGMIIYRVINQEVRKAKRTRGREL